MNAFGRIHGFLKDMARPFSPWSRSVLTAAILAFCIGETYLVSAIVTPPHIDERTWVDRSLKPLWSDDGYPRQGHYAAHHPSFARLVYGGVLNALGIYECDRPIVIYAMDAQRWLEVIIETGNAHHPLKTPPREALVRYPEGRTGLELNISRGAYPPLEIEMPLRLVNVAFLAGMVAFVYFGFKFVFHNRLGALAGCLPIIFCYPIVTGPTPFIGVAPYIGADSMLLFWIAAFWYVWLRLGGGNVWRVGLLGLIGGLMVSTKVNGAFPLAGAGIYFFFASRGPKRILWPLLLGGIAFAVFIAMNPVFRAGDALWMARRLRGVVALMLTLKHLTALQDWGRFTKWEVLSYSFPYWVFYLPVAAVLLEVRRKRSFQVTAAWAAPTIFLNWFLIYVPFPRYAGPIAMAFLVLFGMAGLQLIADSLEKLAEGGRLPLAEGGV